MKVSSDAAKIDALLSRRVAETIVGDSLRKKLLSGKSLRVKFGADPTAPDLHLGHAIALRKLREFQDLGHKAVLIIGDYTALVGDPSGKSKTRPMLTAKEVNANANTYLAQVGKILDLKKTEVRMNGEWFGKLKLSDIIALLSKFTVARMIERDDFAKRLKEGNDVHLHELLYPMMQAYDSVVVKADVEIGATDQKFNILAGRDLLRKMGKPEQDVLLVGPLLVGTDGLKKMSKSYGNYVGIDEPAAQMYGKVMSIPDSLLWDWFALATDVAAEEIAELKKKTEGGGNPRDAKARLAREIVTLYHSAKAAEKAEAAFDSQFRKGERPADIPEMHLSAGEHKLVDVLIAAKLASSKGDARRLLVQGGVEVQGKKEQHPDAAVTVSSEPIILKKGKLHFVSVVAK